MTVLTATEWKPIDFLYELIGGEDRRHAPEGLAELYDDLGARKEWVDKFNAIMNEKFREPAMDWEVVRFLKENYLGIACSIFGRERA